MELVDEYGSLHTIDQNELIPRLHKIEALKKQIGLDS